MRAEAEQNLGTFMCIYFVPGCVLLDVTQRSGVQPSAWPATSPTRTPSSPPSTPSSPQHPPSGHSSTTPASPRRPASTTSPAPNGTASSTSTSAAPWISLTASPPACHERVLRPRRVPLLGLRRTRRRRLRRRRLLRRQGRPTGLRQGLAREVGPHGVTVWSVAPGLIDTDVTGGAFEGDTKTKPWPASLWAATARSPTSPT